jgi:hypothetical protein
MVWFNGMNQTQGNIFVQSYFLNDNLSGQRLCGVSRGGKYIGASLMLQVVFMEFGMINSVSGMLVGESK